MNRAATNSRPLRQLRLFCLAAAAALLLVACGDEPAGQGGHRVPGIAVVAPPAPAPVPVAPPPEPTIEVDATGGRVWMPGRGWISVAEFWDIYRNRPDELTGTLDHAQLALIPAGDLEVAVTPRDDLVPASPEPEPVPVLRELPPESLAEPAPSLVPPPNAPVAFDDSAPGLVMNLALPMAAAPAGGAR